VPPLAWLVASEGRVFFRLPSFMSVMRPYLSTAGVLFLVYKLLPDRGPSFRASLLSAALVGVLLELEKLGLAYYVKQFQGVYEVIYGTLMFLPMLLAWLYLSWCLVLFGATLAAAADEATGHRKHTLVPPPGGGTAQAEKTTNAR
jgi:membrane protein